jgi:3-methyladenine DNA glycosylase AlkD
MAGEVYCACRREVRAEKDFCNIIRDNLGSKEFFINKAIDWALRQYARIDPKSVKKFVNTTKGLSPLGQREALKNIVK